MSVRKCLCNIDKVAQCARNPLEILMLTLKSINLSMHRIVNIVVPHSH